MKMFLIIVTILSFNIWAQNNSKIGQLTSLSRILVRNIDTDKNYCGVSKEESKTFLNVIHAKLDEEKKKFTTLKQIKGILSYALKCQNSCLCDMYTELLEDFKNQKNVKATYTKIALIEKKMTLKRKDLCFKHSLSLCQGPLLKEIRKDSKDFMPGPGL